MTWLRYSLVFVAVAVGVAQIVLWFDIPQDGGLGTAAQLMVPAMIGALIEGQQFAKGHKLHPGGAAAWRFAAVATGIATALNLALAFAGPTVAPEFAKLAIAPVASQQFWVLLVIYAGGYLLCNRFFYGIGSGNQLALMRNRGEIE
jgi:hypothetical protein